jgi:hypothetical protein
VKTLNEDIMTAVAFDAVYLGRQYFITLTLSAFSENISLQMNADRKSFEEKWKLHQEDRKEFVTKRGSDYIEG